jgi:hypothetical protein
MMRERDALHLRASVVAPIERRFGGGPSGQPLQQLSR